MLSPHVLPIYTLFSTISPYLTFCEALRLEFLLTSSSSLSDISVSEYWAFLVLTPERVAVLAGGLPGPLPLRPGARRGAGLYLSVELALLLLSSSLLSQSLELQKIGFSLFLILWSFLKNWYKGTEWVWMHSLIQCYTIQSILLTSN